MRSISSTAVMLHDEMTHFVLLLFLVVFAQILYLIYVVLQWLNPTINTAMHLFSQRLRTLVVITS